MLVKVSLATNSSLMALFKRKINLWNCEDYKCNACRGVFIAFQTFKIERFMELVDGF